MSKSIKITAVVWAILIGGLTIFFTACSNTSKEPKQGITSDEGPALSGTKSGPMLKNRQLPK